MYYIIRCFRFIYALAVSRQSFLIFVILILVISLLVKVKKTNNTSTELMCFASRIRLGKVWGSSLEISRREPGAICISKVCLVHGDLA